MLSIGPCIVSEMSGIFPSWEELGLRLRPNNIHNEMCFFSLLLCIVPISNVSDCSAKLFTRSLLNIYALVGRW